MIETYIFLFGSADCFCNCVVDIFSTSEERKKERKVGKKGKRKKQRKEKKRDKGKVRERDT